MRRVQGLYEAGHLVEVCMRREADGIYAYAQHDLHDHLMLTRGNVMLTLNLIYTLPF